MLYPTSEQAGPINTVPGPERGTGFGQSRCIPRSGCQTHGEPKRLGFRGNRYPAQSFGRSACLGVGPLLRAHEQRSGLRPGAHRDRDLGPEALWSLDGSAPRPSNFGE